MDDKIKIRPILEELKGYLSVAPSPENKSRIFDAELWNQYNSAVDELNSLNDSHDFYEKFRLRPQNENINGHYRTVIKTQDYLSKLSGLIKRIQAEYFSDESNGSAVATTIINANQTQFQKQEQGIIVDLAMFIATRKSDYIEGTPERDFLNKLGETIKSANNIIDIIKSVFIVGKEFGLTLASILKIFGI